MHHFDEPQMKKQWDDRTTKKNLQKANRKEKEI